MVNDYMLDKVLDKIKATIGIVKFEILVQGIMHQDLILFKFL